MPSYVDFEAWFLGLQKLVLVDRNEKLIKDDRGNNKPKQRFQNLGANSIVIPTYMQKTLSRFFWSREQYTQKKKMFRPSPSEEQSNLRYSPPSSYSP